MSRMLRTTSRIGAIVLVPVIAALGVGLAWQTNAYLKFIEDDFLNGRRLDPTTDGRPDPRIDVREKAARLGNLMSDFDFTQQPRPPLVLPTHPTTDLVAPPAAPGA